MEEGGGRAVMVLMRLMLTRQGQSSKIHVIPSVGLDQKQKINRIAQRISQKQYLINKHECSLKLGSC